MNRPSYKEISRKIRQAKEAVLKDNISILKPSVIAADALDLSYEFEEIAGILFDLLEEITPKDYVGQYPPKRSYEEEIFQEELFAFQWVSKRLGGRIYLKFAFKDKWMWLISLHQSRKETKED